MSPETSCQWRQRAHLRAVIHCLTATSFPQDDEDADLLLESLQDKGVSSVAKLMRSERMVALLKRIGEFMDPETGDMETEGVEAAIKVCATRCNHRRLNLRRAGGAWCRARWAGR